MTGICSISIPPPPLHFIPYKVFKHESRLILDQNKLCVALRFGSDGISFFYSLNTTSKKNKRQLC